MNDASPVEVLADHDHDRERLLWICALVFYGVGDTVTTFWGLSAGNVAEAGPIAGPIVDAYGTGAFLGVKVGTIGLFYAVWSILRTSGRVAVPLSLFATGFVVTAWNISIALTAMIA